MRAARVACACWRRYWKDHSANRLRQHAGYANAVGGVRRAQKGGTCKVRSEKGNGTVKGSKTPTVRRYAPKHPLEGRNQEPVFRAQTCDGPGSKKDATTDEPEDLQAESKIGE
jgi:hypothetical protein